MKRKQTDNGDDARRTRRDEDEDDTSLRASNAEDDEGAAKRMARPPGQLTVPGMSAEVEERL